MIVFLFKATFTAGLYIHVMHPLRKGTCFLTLNISEGKLYSQWNSQIPN